jgi:hypothetical protein
MNLRILKKLSKRAAPLIALLGDSRKQFPAEKWECYVSIGACDSKHWERSHAKCPMDRRGEIKYRPSKGDDWIVMRRPLHPLKGTIMVGAMSGYYEPEWDEESAWESLCNIVWGHFTSWEDVTDSTGDCEWPTPTCTRDLSTPKLVFAAAREILADRAAQKSNGGTKQ